MASQGQRLPGQLVDAFQRLHQATVPTQQFGRLYINLSAILGQQQLSPVELQNVIRDLLKQGLGQLLQQSVAASGDEQRLPTSATTATADTGPRSLLPWHTLDLSNQLLGPDGAIELFQVLKETSNRLRSLVLANSSINKTFTGDILHVCKNSNECRVPQWFSHLQWLDLSHNPQLQLLGGDELDLLHLLDFLDVCQQLQGLCLQHTGLSLYQLGRLLDLMHMLLTLDDRSSCEQPESGFKPALSMLQCLKLGPIVQGQDNNSAATTTAAADDASTDSSSGWPEAAFQDVLSRLRMSSPPMNQLVVLELHGLHEQQQQQLNRYVAEVCSMLAQHPERHQQVMHNPLADRQPHLTSTMPGCCRLSWLKPGIILEFEQPVVGLEWEPPPPKPAKPTQAPAETGGIQMQQAAAPFFLPAPAAADAQTPAMGWTRQAGHTRQPPQQQQQQRPEQHTTIRQQPATTPGRPRPATPYHSTGRPKSSVTAAAAAAGTVRQASGIKRQQQQQQQGSRPRPATHQQYNQQQPSITDYTVPGARVPPMDNLDPLNAIPDDADDGDFVLNSSRQRRRQQQAKQQRMARASCHPPDRDADHGHYIGSQDTEPGAAVDDDGDDSDCHAPGLLAKLLQEHDSLYPDSDRSSSLLTDDDQDDAFTGRSNHGTISNSRDQQQQGQHRSKVVKRKRRRTLQAIPLGDDYAAPASRRGQQALPPLESPLSPIGALPGSWQDTPSPDQRSAGMDGDDGRHRDHNDDDGDDGDDDDDADQQQTSEQDDLFIAGDDDDDLEHGMYSQERMRQDSSQQGGDGGDDGSRTQQRRKKHKAGSSVDDDDDDDDDVEALRAFAHERSKLPGQGFGRKGQQLFGRVEDGAKRRPKTVSDGVQSALQRLEQQRARRMTNAVDEDSGDSQQQQQQSGLRSRQQISSAAGETKKRRKSQHTVHKFLDVAAAGGSSPGYRRIEVHASDDDDLGDDDDLHLGGNDEHDDSSDNDPDTGKGTVRRGPAQRATEHHSHLPRPSSAAAAAPTVAAAAAVVDQQTPAGNQRVGRGGLDEPADEPHTLPTAAAAGGGGGGGAGGGSRVKKRSLVAVVESESQDELDLLLQQYQQERLQQQQQLRTREQQESAREVQMTASPAEQGATPGAPSGACTSIGKHEDAQELHQQQLQDTPAPEQQRRQRERSSMQRPDTLTPPMPAADPGTPAVPLAADTAVQDGHDGAVGVNGSAAESDEESSDDIDELPEIQKLREEEKRLQKLKVLEEQLKQQLEAALAAAASTSGAATPAAAGNAQPTVAHDPTEDNAPAAAGASPVAATNPSHTTAAAAAPAGCPQSAVVNSNIEVLAQQLCETKDKRLMVYRLVKELRNSVPFNWDKRGVEARSLRQMNQPQASKRQSRAPERLSPGAIEQQGKLLRQTRQRQQQQQQQQQQQPGDPVFAVPPAAAGIRQAALVGSRRQTKNCKSRGHQEDIGSSSSSESDSDDDDDQPIAVLLCRARAATATSAAGPQRQVPVVDHGVAVPNGGKEGTCDVIATAEDSAVAAAAAGESLGSGSLHAADGAAADAPAADLDEHVAGAETGMMPEQEGTLVESTAAQTQTPQQVRLLIDVAAAAGMLAESAASHARQEPPKTVGAVTNGQSSIVAVDAAHQDEQAVAGVPAGQAAAATTLVDDQAAITGVHGVSGLFAAALRSPWLEASDVGMAALQRDPAARQGPMDPPRDGFTPTPQLQQRVGDVVDVTAITAPTVQASAQQLTGAATADKLVAGPPATAPAADTVQQQQQQQERQQVPDLLAINAVPAEETELAAATAPLPLQLAPQATAVTEFVGAADECKAEGPVAAAPNCIQGDASAAPATPVSAAPEAPVRDALQRNNETGTGIAPAADSLLAEEAGAAEGRVVAVPLYTATAAAGAAESVPGPVVAAATSPKVATTAVASAAQEMHAAVPKSVDQGLELEAGVAQTVGTEYTGAPQVPDTVVQPQTSQFDLGDEVELVIPDSEEE